MNQTPKEADQSEPRISPVPVGPKKNWEKFDDDDLEEVPIKRDEVEKIVINKPEGTTSETTTVDLYVNDETDAKEFASVAISTPPPTIETTNTTVNPSEVITLETIPAAAPKERRVVIKEHQPQGFINGDVIVNLFPVNENLPWITPAIFRKELVPEELMAQELTLTIEDYVDFMQILVSDKRFKIYNMCYKRVLGLWIVLAFVILLSMLLSGVKGILLFALGVSWLFINACAIFFCVHIKLKIYRGLERCMAKVNKSFIKHKIIVVTIDRGHISCHKVNLNFIYYDSTECINTLNNFIYNHSNKDAIKKKIEGWVDTDSKDSKSTSSTSESSQINYGEVALLRYSQRWGSDALKGMIDVSALEPARHCIKYKCLCKYIEHYLANLEDYPCSGCLGPVSDHIYAY
jgi:hypothetical protein